MSSRGTTHAYMSFTFPYFNLHLQKIFYTRGTLRSPHWLKSQPFIVIGWDPWSKKRGNYLSCIEGKGVRKTFKVVQKMSGYLLIYNKISFAPAFQSVAQTENLTHLGVLKKAKVFFWQILVLKTFKTQKVRLYQKESLNTKWLSHLI